MGIIKQHNPLINIGLDDVGLGKESPSRTSFGNLTSLARRALIFSRASSEWPNIDSNYHLLDNPDKDYKPSNEPRESASLTRKKQYAGTNSPFLPGSLDYNHDTGNVKPYEEDSVKLIILREKIKEFEHQKMEKVDWSYTRKQASSSYQVIELPFIPEKIDSKRESQWNAIPSIGRNNPYQHFTGSEGSVEFEIDWYAFDPGRRQAIDGCRMIESLSMSDGYDADPPIVMIQWGSYNSIFSKSLFIVEKAPYQLSNFTRATIVTEKINGRNEVRANSLIPVQAKQQVKLKRVGSISDKAYPRNLTHGDINGEVKDTYTERKTVPGFNVTS